MSQPMIRLLGVSKTFPGQSSPAVSELSLDINEGEIVVLVGPSGCGKTTTLKMINRLVEATSGTIDVEGVDITQVEPHVLRQGMGYVIQRIGLFPHRRVAENIATVPQLVGWSKERIRQRLDELIDVVGLEQNMRDRYPSELSGGQQQRVGVARALAADPPVLLMDEPFGAVDPIVRARLQDQLLDLQARLHKTIVFVTHDIDEAIKLGDRVALMNVGGALEQYAPPAEILARPANPFVEQFLGEDRGLKQLSIVPVRNVELPHGPVVDVQAGVAAAVEAVADHRSDWVGLTDGGRLLGWIFDKDLDPSKALAEHSIRSFRVTVGADASLREALDALLNEHNHVAMVEDQGAYLGMLTIDHMSEVLRQ